MASSTSRDAVVIEGLDDVLRALRRLPKEAQDELRLASQEITEVVAADARARAAALGRGWKYLGPTIKARKDRVPFVSIGGSRRLPGRKGARQSVGDLLYGTEFGGGARPTTRQFLRHRGTIGYALYPAVRDHAKEVGERYSEALLRALEAI